MVFSFNAVKPSMIFHQNILKVYKNKAGPFYYFLVFLYYFNEVKYMKYLSFFSGALGLDLGFENIGFTPLLYCEIDKKIQKTIKTNRPNIPLIDDINLYSAQDIKKIIGISTFDIIVGGPPCQAFSTAGRRKSFDDNRGNVFLHFLHLSTELSPKYIIIENVRGLLSAVYSPLNNKNEKGSALKFIINFLEKKGYGVTFNLYNTANFGTPHIRERIVIIACNNNQKVPYLEPTHSQKNNFNLLPWVKLKDIICNIPKEKNKNCAKFPEKRIKYYKLLKSGQNWRNLPEDLQKEALGKSFYLGGGKTGFLRRLDWEKPSPTLVTTPTMPATDLAHPEENRPLSVAEYARIQQFPDNWIFFGNIYDQYKQIGNAVPVGFGEAIAKLIKKHANQEKIISYTNFSYSRYKYTSEKNWTKAFKASASFDLV